MTSPMSAKGDLKARRVIAVTIDGVPVKLRRRPDGGLRLYSDAMPGLILSGADWWAVLSDAPLAIKVIARARR